MCFDSYETTEIQFKYLSFFFIFPGLYLCIYVYVCIYNLQIQGLTLQGKYGDAQDIILQS